MILKISQKAAHHYYGGGRLALVCAREAKLGAKALKTSGFTVLVLSAEGLICLPGEDAELADKTAGTVLGIGAGLMAIIASGACEGAAQQWQAYVQSCAPHQRVHFCMLKGFAYQKRKQLQRCLTAVLAEVADALANQLSVLTAENTVLRRDQMHLNEETNRLGQLLELYGFDGKAPLFEVPIGEDAIGPEAEDQMPFSLEQPLMVDGQGLSELWLYCPESAPTGEGDLIVSILQAGSGQVLACVSRPFAEVVSGWNQFSFPGISMGGDVILRLTWHGSVLAPKLALAAVSAQAGEGQPSTPLAMRLFTRIRPARSAAVGGAAAQPALMDMERVTLSPAHLLARMQPVGPQESISLSQEEGWLQTHPVAHAFSGIALDKMSFEALQAVTVSVETAHASGPTCRFWLVAAAEGMPLETIQNHLKTGEARSDDIVSASVTLAPQTPTTLSLKGFADLKTTSGTLLLLVESLREQLDFGWCRWQQFEMFYTVKRARPQDSLPALAVTAAAQGRRVRSMRFPEIFSQVESLIGRVGTQRIYEEKGFSPLVISEETGSLQTHPLETGFSGAICPGLVPTDASSVSCIVETMHAGAPDFIYVMVAIERGQNALAVLSGLEQEVREKAQELMPMTAAAPNGVLYNARRVRPLIPCVIELEGVNLAKGGPKDLVCAVLSLDGNVTCGWCRWHSVTIEQRA